MRYLLLAITDEALAAASEIGAIEEDADGNFTVNLACDIDYEYVNATLVPVDENEYTDKYAVQMQDVPSHEDDEEEEEDDDYYEDEE